LTGSAAQAWQLGTHLPTPQPQLTFPTSLFLLCFVCAEVRDGILYSFGDAADARRRSSESVTPAVTLERPPPPSPPPPPPAPAPPPQPQPQQSAREDAEPTPSENDTVRLALALSAGALLLLAEVRSLLSLYSVTCALIITLPLVPHVKGRELVEGLLEITGLGVTALFLARLVFDTSARADLVAWATDKFKIDPRFKMDSIATITSEAPVVQPAMSTAAEPESEPEPEPERVMVMPVIEAPPPPPPAPVVVNAVVVEAPAPAPEAPPMHAAGASESEEVGTALVHLDSTPAVGDHIMKVLQSLPAGKYSVLLEALEVSGLNAVLSTNGPYTLLAPDNDALLKALRRLKMSKGQLLAQKNLRQILKYHLLRPGSSAVTASEVAAAPEGVLSGVPTGLSGKTLDLTMDVAGNLLVNKGAARVKLADIAASNGIIHTIDTILMP
jgi:uncharacterized surface protein with fasciclin (FAS1) repeats